MGGSSGSRDGGFRYGGSRHGESSERAPSGGGRSDGERGRYDRYGDGSRPDGGSRAGSRRADSRANTRGGDAADGGRSYPRRATDRSGTGEGGRGGDGSRGGYPNRGQRADDGERRLDVPDSITADQLDPEALAELRTLPGDLAEVVARLLVATSVTEDPQRAYEYAKKARGLAARVGVVRETSAIAAYQAGDWTGALAEFRAARRLTGRSSYLPLMADCERALGRLDRALDIVTGPDARAADHRTQIELRIVESGIRRDQGLLDAAVVVLQGPELAGERIRPEYARLYYAYADALLAVGREDEAREWFGRAAAADVDGDTDAAERYEELDDLSFDDLGDAWDRELADGDHEAAGELGDVADNDLVVDQGFDEDDEE